MQWNSLLILMKNYDDIQLTVNGFLQFYLRMTPTPNDTRKIHIHKHARWQTNK